MKKTALFFLILFGFSLNAEEISWIPYGELRTDFETYRTDSYKENSFYPSAKAGLWMMPLNLWIEGTVSIQDDGPKITEAWAGGRIFETGPLEVLFETGRIYMGDIYESKIQFKSPCTTVVGTYKFYIPDIINFTMKGGPIFDSESPYRYGWIAEAALENVGSLPIDFKYSLTNWNHTDFAISQFMAKFHYKILQVYGAYLTNHVLIQCTDGYYFGVTYGNPIARHDWSIDLNYQHIMTHSIPDFERRGIGKGAEVKGTYFFTDKFSMEMRLALCSGMAKNAQFSMVYKW